MRLVLVMVLDMLKMELKQEFDGPRLGRALAVDTLRQGTQVVEDIVVDFAMVHSMQNMAFSLVQELYFRHFQLFIVCFTFPVLELVS